MRRMFVPAACVIALTVASSPASAIDCDGNFQVQRGGQRIATPYCEDNYLAQVAQAYGMHVSAHAIRANPSVKQKACQLAGDDNRVRDTCQQYRNDDPSVRLR